MERTKNKVFNLFFLCIFLLSFVPPVFAQTTTVGVYGNIYKIKEKDLIKVIKYRADRVNWKEYRKKQHFKRQIENYQPYNQEVNLPDAIHTKVFKPNMWYALKFAVKDSNGNVIYPKGFRYKITDYITLPNIIVVINGDEKKQVKWFKESKFYNNISTMFMITKGNYFKLDKALKIPVYYYMSALQKRFALKAVPSVIWQKGHNLYVEQIGENQLKEDLIKWKKKNSRNLNLTKKYAPKKPKKR